jgi:hypothetical protein
MRHRLKRMQLQQNWKTLKQLSMKPKRHWEKLKKH